MDRLKRMGLARPVFLEDDAGQRLLSGEFEAPVAGAPC
jgi:hypothetical protein